jgi:hypothetical protein
MVLALVGLLAREVDGMLEEAEDAVLVSPRGAFFFGVGK